MRKKYRQAFKIIVFCVLTGIVFVGINWFLQPVWPDWGNYDRIYGFYEEPENTIETVFLGSSSTITGITPMELYENYGICAYNLATEQQPMLVSYYWLEEAYRMHPDTLKTAILDCSGLSRSHQVEFCRKAIEGMRLSPIKYRAVRDYTDNLSECLSYMVPILSYHSRWAEIEKSDFEKLRDLPDNYLRGYSFGMGRYLEAGDYDTLAVPEYILDEKAKQSELDKEALSFLKKMIDFCKDKGIELVLMKTPVAGWTSSNHNAISAIAENHELDFLDFNSGDLLEELNYNYALDSGDGGHMNYYGASKLTDWLGGYLVKRGIATDVRDNPRYHFMQEEFKQYQSNVSDIAILNAEKDPCTYVALAEQNPDRTIFITVKGDAAGALTEEQRQKFKKLGLKKLAELGKQDSYLAVIKDGEEIYEQVQACQSEDMLLDKKLAEISYRGQFRNGIWYTLTSGGDRAGDIASCSINGIQYARNGRGLNFVIYDNCSQNVVDSTYFDTSVSNVRQGDIAVEFDEALAEKKPYTELSERLKNLYLYNYRCERAKNIEIFKKKTGANELWKYLLEYWESKNTVIFLLVEDDSSGVMDKTARIGFREIGLHKLAKLKHDESYLAVIEEGKIIFEQKCHKGIPIKTDGIGYKLFSGGFESDNMSSILIHGEEYSLGEPGINVVLFDKQLDMVIDRVVFD